LGDLYRGAGDFQQALAAFRDAIARDPSEASQWNSMGMMLGAGGELSEAERAFREAVQRDPREPRYTFNLALTLEREHRAADAAAYFRKTLEIDPRAGVTEVERLLEPRVDEIQARHAPCAVERLHVDRRTRREIQTGDADLPRPWSARLVLQVARQLEPIWQPVDQLRFRDHRS